MAMNEGRYRAAEQRLWQTLRVTPTERRLRLARLGVTVRVQAVGQGPAVLFVHGAATCGTSWASLVARLPGFRCLLLDRPGCGLSDPLPTRLDTIDALSHFAETLIVDVLDALQLERTHLVATSFGGYVALRTAAAHPARIGRMVEFGWPAGAPSAGIPWLLRVTSIPMLARALDAVPPNEPAVQAIFRSIGLRQALAARRIA